jgi:hypothetical protein
MDAVADHLEEFGLVASQAGDQEEHKLLEVGLVVIGTFLLPENTDDPFDLKIGHIFE